ncbi:PEP-CTERM sorting domain-containing protein [Lacipirellula sp.]|uniref:PEP-CTERM sorting domain-containing protein n=1 Tax=Lacipirellula sp. TaxID=2691419 RepID=UPI003D0BC1FD
MKAYRVSLIAALAAMAAAQLQAATLVSYKLSGVANAAVPSVAASPSPVGITNIALTRGAGINAAALTNGFSADTWNRPAPSLENAIANGDYFQWGLGVAPGYTASLSTADLALRRSAASSPMNMQLQASLDNFATPGIVISSFNYYGRTSGTAPGTPPAPYEYMTTDVPGRLNAGTSPGDPIPTVNLSSFTSLQNLAGGANVTFRLYAWGNASTTATNTFALGRMIGPAVGGDVAVAVPEPTSLALVCGAAMIGLAIRRRQ